MWGDRARSCPRIGPRPTPPPTSSSMTARSASRSAVSSCTAAARTEVRGRSETSQLADDEALVHEAQVLGLLRRDLAVEYARFPRAQLALDLRRRARAQEHHEELLVRRQLALAAIAEGARADGAAGEVRQRPRWGR